MADAPFRPGLRRSEVCVTPEMTWWVRLADSVRAAGRGEAPLDEPVRMVRDGLGFDCATLVGPQRATTGQAHPVLVNLDYPGDAIRFISTTYAAECPAHRYITEQRVAGRFIDLPYDFRSSRTYREALKPNGFHEGLTLPLGVLRHGSPRPGFLALSSTHGRPLRDEALLGLTMLASEIASLTDPRATRPPAPADLVVWVGRGTLDVRVGDVAAGPFTTRDLSRIGALHQRTGAALGFRHRDGSRGWWHVTTDAAGDGVLIRIQEAECDDHLTPRELDVVGLLSRGWTNDEIATALGISVRTTRTHVEAALMKLGVPNRTALGREALLRDLDSLDAIRCVAEASHRSLPA
ncbi:helix-turn-helix transcriptional regulator [Dietzia sp. SYD-A1]|uniref:helix-turn-helix transcriptional regulator n=1 Tax=Dietzia sp. SYD-A1 TaxID=2780141 RepID=UPI001E5E1146|nr:helix-turn-helix transcriptional regulator [Dietzia sp. SYD-A1]